MAEALEHRIWNKRTESPPPEAIYVGRPSRWGNPYKIGKLSRQEAVDRFEMLLEDSPDRQADVYAELRGKDLVCWCAPLPCHAEVLMKVANR